MWPALEDAARPGAHREDAAGADQVLQVTIHRQCPGNPARSNNAGQVDHRGAACRRSASGRPRSAGWPIPAGAIQRNGQRGRTWMALSGGGIAVLAAAPSSVHRWGPAGSPGLDRLVPVLDRYRMFSPSSGLGGTPCACTRCTGAPAFPGGRVAAGTSGNCSMGLLLLVRSSAAVAVTGGTWTSPGSWYRCTRA